MSEENFKEKRKAPRFKADGKVGLVFEDGDTAIKGQLVDISRIGVFVMVNQPLESWAYKMCRMEITTRVNDEELLFKGRSVIVRIAAKGVGMYINEIDEEFRLNFVKFMGYVQVPENAV
ncbi:MAG: PilZ domain-containing protein [Pseudomonadales bacterium]|nr:PilZ domain-containing protein [Pseudomonadales bacterium]